MPGTSSVLSFPFAPTLARGVHFELYHGRKVHFAVDSHGERLPFIGVPIGQESEDDVIGRLWDSLEGAEPRPHVAWGDRLTEAGRRAGHQAVAAGGRVLPFVAPLLLRHLHR